MKGPTMRRAMEGRTRLTVMPPTALQADGGAREEAEGQRMVVDGLQPQLKRRIGRLIEDRARLSELEERAIGARHDRPVGWKRSRQEFGREERNRQRDQQPPV